MTALYVMLGGAMGTWLRYSASLVCAERWGSHWPYGTFLVNVVGSFMLGVLSEVGAGRTLHGVDLRLVLGTGVLGGFTTYSSFNLESLRLAQQGEAVRALSYVGATLLCCLLAGVVGLWLGGRLVR